MPIQLPEPPKTAPKAFGAMARALAKLILWAGQWEKLEVGTGLKLVKATEGHRLTVVPEQLVAAMSGVGVGVGRVIPFSGTAAGIVPTAAEVETGIEAAYSSTGYTPARGDFLYSTAFHYIVAGARDTTGATITGNGIWRVTFQIGGVGYVAFNVGPNRLF